MFEEGDVVIEVVYETEAEQKALLRHIRVLKLDHAPHHVPNQRPTRQEHTLRHRPFFFRLAHDIWWVQTFFEVVDLQVRFALPVRFGKGIDTSLVITWR